MQCCCIVFRTILLHILSSIRIIFFSATTHAMSATVRDMALIGSLRAEIVTVFVAFMEFFLIKAVATEQRCRVTSCTRTRKIGVKQGPKCMIAVGITDCARLASRIYG